MPRVHASPLLRRTLAWLATAGLSSCAVGPDFHRPAAPQTDRYTLQPLAQSLVAGQNPPADWWKGFGSSAIDALVQQALLANSSMHAAEATLRQSLENVAAQRGYYSPTITAEASATRNRDATQVLSPTLTSGAATYSLYTPQLVVSFVPDVFGGNRRQVESLQALADANRYEHAAAYLTLVANVVSAAIQEAGLRAQIRATQQVIDLERESLTVMRAQLDLGGIAAGGVLAQEAALALIEATLPPLRKALDQQHDLLAALTGQLPGDAPDVQLELDQLKLPQIPVGVPSQLVERRPDVRAAEAQLHAATAAVGVAIANLLPQLTITGDIGSTASLFTDLFKPGTGFWNLGAHASQTLFAGGTLVHRKRAADAALDQAAAQYRSAVLTAFQNVADALHALDSDADALQAASRAEDAAQKSLGVARHQLDLGSVNYLALLSSEQTYQQAVVSLAQARGNRLA